MKIITDKRLNKLLKQEFITEEQYNFLAKKNIILGYRMLWFNIIKEANEMYGIVKDLEAQKFNATIKEYLDFFKKKGFLEYLQNKEKAIEGYDSLTIDLFEKLSSFNQTFLGFHRVNIMFFKRIEEEKGLDYTIDQISVQGLTHDSE